MFRLPHSVTLFLLPVWAALALLILPVAANGQEGASVIGYIESFSGAPQDYGIQRDAGEQLPVRLRTQVRAGDQIEVKKKGETAVLQFTDGSQVKLGPAARWYGPYAERGSEASLLSNLMNTVASTVADFSARSVQTVVTAARGEPIALGSLFTEYPLVLAAGQRSLYLRWSGGEAPYGVRITRLDDGTELVTVAELGATAFRSAAVDLTPGEYEVVIAAPDQETRFAFLAVPASDLPPPIATPGMAEAVSTYLNAYALAVTANNAWSFEAYQRLALLADRDYQPAAALLQELENGEARYWEPPEPSRVTVTQRE
jgi:hypothetical protein